mmetsp:Transcript_30298/g.78417  ORF Transcript_30298/g.78417 Transcript_30298/m.78417 type:complete len:244 (-) Transcript_30298:1695-2426(-)
MVHFAIMTTENKDGTFKSFIILNPQLANGSLFLEYYSADLMLKNPSSRKEFALPDKKQLPSIVPSAALPWKNRERFEEVVSAMQSGTKNLDLGDPEDAESYIQAFKEKRLSAWGHRPYLRLLYAFLETRGFRGSKAVDDAHATISHGYPRTRQYYFTFIYFWIHFLRIFHAKAMKERNGGAREQDPTFAEVWEMGITTLGNSNLLQDYYSTPILSGGMGRDVSLQDVDKTFVLPDLKKLPQSI